MGRSVGSAGCGAWFRAGAHDSIMSMGTVMSTSSRGSGAGIVCGWRCGEWVGGGRRCVAACQCAGRDTVGVSQGGASGIAGRWGVTVRACVRAKACRELVPSVM